MMTSVRRGSAFLLALATAACDGSGPSAPTQYPVQPPTVQWPKPVANARTFGFYGELDYPVRGYTSASNFILYDSGTFALRWGTNPVYRGTYKEAAGVIDFVWDGYGFAGPWLAAGTLEGDLLTVRYNLVMIGTDFEDARYKLVR
jgi:hypothetical protein